MARLISLSSSWNTAMVAAAARAAAQTGQQTVAGNNPADALDGAGRDQARAGPNGQQ